MDILVRERNGEDELWYSEKYVTEQIKLAHQAGVHAGIQVEFHTISPINGENVEFLVQEEYEKSYNEVLKLMRYKEQNWENLRGLDDKLSNWDEN
jgi:hypothetical protein